MEGPRAPTQAEFSELVSFLDQNLRHDTAGEWSIAQEYPTVVTPQNMHNVRIIKDDQKILSHALVKPIICKTRRGLFKVGGIGSVVTDNAYRNQGLSQTILQSCLQSLEEQACDFAILWTNLYDFYRKLGFELGGSEVSLVIEQPMKIPPHSFQIIQNNRADVQALYRLYFQHTVCSIRTLEDFEKFLKIPQSRLYTGWNTEGKMEAFCVEGKGADLQGYIHEWGGTVDALTALINHIRLKQNKPVTVISPSHSQGLIRRLESLGARRVEGFLGMIKIINTESFFQKIIKNVRQEWGVSHFILEKKDGFYFFGVGSDLFKTDSESDIIRLLFGPKKPSEIHDCGPKVNAILDRIFPIEMWVWGWDSV